MLLKKKKTVKNQRFKNYNDLTREPLEFEFLCTVRFFIRIFVLLYMVRMRYQTFDSYNNDNNKKNVYTNINKYTKVHKFAAP